MLYLLKTSLEGRASVAANATPCQ